MYKKTILFTLLLGLLQISQPAFGMETKKHKVVPTILSNLPHDCFNPIFGFLCTNAKEFIQFTRVCKNSKAAVNHCKFYGSNLKVCIRPETAIAILKIIQKNNTKETAQMFDGKNSFFKNNNMCFKIDISGDEMAKFALSNFYNTKKTVPVLTLFKIFRKNKLWIQSISFSPLTGIKQTFDEEKRYSILENPYSEEQVNLSETENLFEEILKLCPNLDVISLISIAKTFTEEWDKNKKFFFAPVENRQLLAIVKFAPQIKELGIKFAPNLNIRMAIDKGTMYWRETQDENDAQIKTIGKLKTLEVLKISNFNEHIEEIFIHGPKEIKTLEIYDSFQILSEFPHFSSPKKKSFIYDFAHEEKEKDLGFNLKKIETLKFINFKHIDDERTFIKKAQNNFVRNVLNLPELKNLIIYNSPDILDSLYENTFNNNLESLFVYIPEDEKKNYLNQVQHNLSSYIKTEKIIVRYIKNKDKR